MKGKRKAAPTTSPGTSQALALPEKSNGVQLCLDELLAYKSQTVHWQAPARSLWSQLNGGHQSRHQGRGMDFAEVRQYQAGDDIRSIDWRVTARTGKTHTKLFTEEREQPVILYIDLSTTMRFGSQLMLKSVQAAHMASLISWLTVSNGDRIGAIIDDGASLYDLKPTARAKGALYIADQMVRKHSDALSITQASENSTSVTDVLLSLHRLCPKGSDVILISDFQRFGDKHQALLSQLRQHNHIRAIQISDPLEHGETQYKGLAHVKDAFSSAWLNFGSKATKDKIEQKFQHALTPFTQACQSLAIPTSEISSNVSLLTQLHDLQVTGGQNGR